MTASEVSYYSPPSDKQQLNKLPVIKFIKFVEQHYNRKFGSYASLHRWSCDHYADFWEAVLKFSGVLLKSQYSQVVETVRMDKVPKWFMGAELNYAENLLYAHQNTDPEKIAVIDAKSETVCKYYTYDRLRSDVKRLAIALKHEGITKGDRIVGFLTNSYEAAVAMLATTAIGAVWSSASVDFGTLGVLDRFQQLNPVVLFSAVRTTYKGKEFNLENKITEIIKGLPSLRKVILTNVHQSEIPASLEADPLCVPFVQFLQGTSSTENFQFTHVPFGHPLFIMFSSGTTGSPKGLVHTVGGTLLKHLAEHLLQTGFQSDDSILFYTTCGWMMWNWLMSSFFIGMSVVLFDESPLLPDPHILFKIVAKHRCTILGMGAKVYEEYVKLDDCPAKIYDLSSVRMVLSTGSPLSNSCFRYINNSIRAKAVIGSISGGTDIIGCFMGASELLPVIEGECQCSYLGMDMASYNDQGEPVLGVQGELVCRKPFPSMPSHFINDPDGVKYKKAYFDRFDGIWTHGDYCCINPDTGGIIMLGRSDATLNRGGVRIGTAEIYEVVQKFDEIVDSIVAPQKLNGNIDERIILFVKMAPSYDLTDQLISKLKQQLRTLMSPRHAPDTVVAVDDIPYTISGKKMEVAVREVLNEEKVARKTSMRNPESLEYFRPKLLTTQQSNKLIS